jgi:CHAD domain-containing protein
MNGGTFELPGGTERRPETGGGGEIRSRGSERLTLGPGLGIIDAAHLGLTERFEAVARALEDLHESPHGVRETHALRVATRRAAAALLVFGPHVDPARARKARRDLRELRRAAGAVRVCDVQEELLHAAERGTPDASGMVTADEAGVVAAELMLGRVQRWREKARRGLVEARENYRPTKARRAGEKLSQSAHMALGRVGGSGVPAFRMVSGASTAGDAARAAVNSASQRFWEAVRHAESSGDALGAGGEFEALHEMRLAGKRLRYVVEVMSSCLDEEAGETAVSTLRKLQDRLGEVNDRHELAKRTQDAAAELGLSGGLAGGKTARAFVSLRESLVASRDALLDDFEVWWESKRRKLGVVLTRLGSRTGGGALRESSNGSLASALNEAIDSARTLLVSPAVALPDGNAENRPAAVPNGVPTVRSEAEIHTRSVSQPRQEATA